LAIRFHRLLIILSARPQSPFVLPPMAAEDAHDRFLPFAQLLRALPIDAEKNVLSTSALRRPVDAASRTDNQILLSTPGGPPL
jgi:hypothetical protein